MCLTYSKLTNEFISSASVLFIRGQERHILSALLLLGRACAQSVVNKEENIDFSQEPDFIYVFNHSNPAKCEHVS